MLNHQVTRALHRLDNVLPLKQRQSQLDGKYRNLHRQLLRSFVDQGRILNRQEIADLVDDVDHAIQILTGSGLVVISESGELTGAYPFSIEARDHKIQINGQLIHAMCALDSLAASLMFGMPAEIKSLCCVSGEPIHILQSGDGSIESKTPSEIYFAIDWGAFSESATCADSLCLQMNFIVCEKQAKQWMKEDRDRREIFNLQDAVEFSTQFFVPLME